MKVEYRENSQPGHGRFVFSEALIPESPWAVSIQRGSDKRFLTGKAQNPWVGETYFIPLEGAGEQDGSLALNIGPGIVDRLDQQDVYRLNLKGADGEPQKAQLRIGAINYSPSGSLDNTADVRLEETQETEPTAQSARTGETEPRSGSAPAPSPEPAPERLEMREQAPHPQNRHYWRWALLVFLAIACVAWYIFDPRNKDQAPANNTAAQAPNEAPKEVLAPLPPASVEDQVRAFFKGGKITPKQAVELAAQLPKATPAEQDAVYRLYYFAAENDEPSVLLAYGACLDPSRPDWGSIEKNAAAAWNVYRRAPDQEKAAQAMTHLRGWLEDQSRLGNKKAAQWLREIEQ